MKKKTELIFTAFTALVLALTMSFTALAWFYFEQWSGSAGFLTGESDPIDLAMARVKHEEKEENRAWESCADSFGMTAPVKNGEYYNIQLSDLSFGSIDNLSFLRPENVIYLRIAIDKNDGNTIRFNVGNYIGYGGYFFSIYQNIYDENESVVGQKLLSTENTEDNEIIAAFDAVQNPGADGTDALYYLQYSYAFSTTEYAANEIDAASQAGELDFGDVLYDFSSDYAAEVGTKTATYEGYDDLADDSKYYLYIKLVPNLNAFSKSIDVLFEIMPGIVLFNVGVSAEIYYFQEDVEP